MQEEEQKRQAEERLAESNNESHERSERSEEIDPNIEVLKAGGALLELPHQ